MDFVSLFLIKSLAYFREIADDYDLELYRAMLNDKRCIHQFLPAKNVKSVKPVTQDTVIEDSVIEDTVTHYLSANMISIKTSLSIDALKYMLNFVFIV
jgi:hypothetical protein